MARRGTLSQTDLRLLLYLVANTQGQILAGVADRDALERLADRWAKIAPEDPMSVEDRLDGLNTSLRVAMGELF